MERKWDEEVDAPKRGLKYRKETSQKKAAVRKPRGPLASICPIAGSSRQHPITDPRMSIPAVLRSNALRLLTRGASSASAESGILGSIVGIPIDGKLDTGR